MRQIIILLVLGIIFITLQTTLLAALPSEKIRPDLIFILTLYLSLYCPLISGGMLAFFMGFLMDLFSGNSFGLYTLTRPVIFYIAQFFKGRFYLESFASQFLFVFIFCLVEGFLLHLLLYALNPGFSGNLYPLFLTHFLPQLFFTALIAPVFFAIIRKGSFFLFRPDRMRDGGKRG